MKESGWGFVRGSLPEEKNQWRRQFGQGGEILREMYQREFLFHKSVAEMLEETAKNGAVEFTLPLYNKMQILHRKDVALKV